MFSHVSLGVTDFDRALRFYRGVLGRLGIEERFCEPDVPWAGWQPAGGGRPFFFIVHPLDGKPMSVGNGQMTAFLASDRKAVRDAHARALDLGGSDEGEPGLRPHYHAYYFGAYFRDPDGNKLCVVCHDPEG